MPPINLQVKSDPILLSACAITHALAIPTLILMPVSAPLLVVLTLAVFVSFVRAWSKLSGRGGNAIVRVVCSDQEWFIQRRDSRVTKVKLVAYLVTSGWVLLQLGSNRYSREVVFLTCFSVDAEKLRRLRVMLHS